MSGAEDDEDELAHEGVEAFNAMTAAMRGLNGRMDGFERGLADQVKAARQVASTAETAATNAQRAAEHAAATARAGARSAASWAVLGALAGILVAGGASYWLGHASGHESGLAEGYRAAQDEKAAAAWANTPNGRLAYALDKAGGLAPVTACNSAGWWTETRQGRRYCFVGPAPDRNTYGWPLP